eukprot:TRINITY_DN102_c1_g1_i1.p1 TRINITY_DN102_c1_g1~~TRINITY_DN102_c1_g1_i1.p1  ORF type:complete len:402 (+),score=113.90 TRINITY_DN102_c1_g1_i1:41-1207(+)
MSTRAGNSYLSRDDLPSSDSSEDEYANETEEAIAPSSLGTSQSSSVTFASSVSASTSASSSSAAAKPAKKAAATAADDDELLKPKRSSIVVDCRMYENKYPEVDDLVKVQVTSIADMGAYVSLLEYNRIEGMILLSELSRRRIRSVNKHIRVDREEVVVVLRVDKEKGYIDLSKRRVSSEEVAKMEDKYSKSKTVHSIMRHVAETLQVSLEGLYVHFGWPLYREFGHAFEAFKRAVTEPEILAKYNLSPELEDCLLKNIQRRMAPQQIKLRADISVSCLAYEGIDAIKAALKAGQAIQFEGKNIDIRLVAPPHFVLNAQTLDKDTGIEALKNAIKIIETEIVKSGGELRVMTEARAVTERDDKELEDLITELELRNREVDGDDDSGED